MSGATKSRLIAAAVGGSFLAAAVVFGATTTSGLRQAASAAPPATTTICLVPPTHRSTEITVTVPRVAVPALLAQTASYEGVCAAYGTPSMLGNGTIRTYTQIVAGKPVTIGATFPRSALSGLPNQMTDAHHCFDVNDDGTIDTSGMTECAGGHERPLDLPSALIRLGTTPLKWTLINWNPHGHGAPGVYDVPHFDFHFYIQPQAERDAIRPGPCGIVVDCTDYATGSVPVPPANLPADYSDLKFVEVAMGNHLLDQTSPEWHGVPFTRTFIYGSYNGKITFLEPMITMAWLQGLVAGSSTPACLPVKWPQAWQVIGYYPRQYCVRYRANRDDFTVSMENFER